MYKTTCIGNYTAILMSIPHILDLKTDFTLPKYVVIVYISNGMARNLVPGASEHNGGYQPKL